MTVVAQEYHIVKSSEGRLLLVDHGTWLSVNDAKDPNLLVSPLPSRTTTGCPITHDCLATTTLPSLAFLLLE